MRKSSVILLAFTLLFGLLAVNVLWAAVTDPKCEWKGITSLTMQYNNPTGPSPIRVEVVGTTTVTPTSFSSVSHLGTFTVTGTKNHGEFTEEIVFKLFDVANNNFETHTISSDDLKCMSVGQSFGSLVVTSVDKLYKLESYVWHDVNGDGSWSGETGIPDVTVTLSNGESTTISSTTDSNGKYKFDWMILPDGIYTIDVNEPAGYTLTTGNEPLAVDLSSGCPASFDGNFGYNTAPVVVDIPDQTIAEGSTFTTISLDDYVSDVDNTDAQMTWTCSGNSELTVSITDRVATITIPNENWNGSETITFRATDPGSLYDEDPATFTVSAVNDAPVANDDSDTTPEDTPVTTNVVANDTDVDGTVVASAVAIVSGPSNGSVVNNGNGTVTYTPNANFNGSDSFTYTVKDNGGATSNVATVTINVGVVNDAPVANDDSTTTPEDTPVTTNVVANDTDVDGTVVVSMVAIVSRRKFLRP